MKKFICIFTLTLSVFLSFAKEKILSENEYPDFIKEFIDGKPYIVYGRTSPDSPIYYNKCQYFIEENVFDVKKKATKDGKIYNIYLNKSLNKSLNDIICTIIYKFENSKLIEYSDERESIEYIVKSTYKYKDNKLYYFNFQYYEKDSEYFNNNEYKLEYTNNEIIMDCYNSKNYTISINVDNNIYDDLVDYTIKKPFEFELNNNCKVYYDKNFKFKKAEDDEKIIELKDNYLIKTYKDKSTYYYTFYYDFDLNMIKRIGKNHSESRTYQNGKCICIESEDNGKKTIEYLDYNEKGLVVSEKRLNDDGEWFIDEYKYDDKNRIIYQISKNVDKNEKLISQKT